MNDAGTWGTFAVDAGAAAAAAAAPATALTPALRAALERELARCVGPVAEVLVRRAAQRHDSVEALVRGLLPAIEGKADREAFAQAVARLVASQPKAETATAAPAASAPAVAPASPPPPAAAAVRAPAAPAMPPAPPPTRLAHAAPLPAQPSAIVRPIAPAPAAERSGAPVRMQVRAPIAPPPPALPAARADALAAIASTPATALSLPHAAHALLDTLAHLKVATRSRADTSTLQTQVLARMNAFDTQAAQVGDAAARTAAEAMRHALRCCLDEAIDTPAAQSAAHELYEPLPRLLGEPAAQAPLLALYAACVALGFEGHWRGQADAATRLAALGQRLHALHPGPRGAALRTLSPHWRGVATQGARAASALPLWAAAALGGVALLALWFALNARLDARARPLFAGIAAVPVALDQNAARAAARPRLAALLPAGDPTTEVRDEAQRSVIVLSADALFVDGQARLDTRAAALLGRVAQALRGRAGELSVIGHGDNAPPASLQFPSHWHFTRARAQAVADAMAALGVGLARVEGRAEFEPRAANDSVAGRARNRRIEIELRLTRPEEEIAP